MSDTIVRVKRIHDQLSNKWERRLFWLWGKRIRTNEFELVLKLLNPKKREVVLDVGCGTARFACASACHGANVNAADVSSKMVRVARERVKQLKLDADLLACDGRNLPYREAVYDKVLCVGLLEHVGSEDQRKLVKEVGRVLKADGLLILTSANKGPLMFISWLIERIITGLPKKFHDERALKELLQKCGLKPKEVRYTGLRSNRHSALRILISAENKV